MAGVGGRFLPMRNRSLCSLWFSFLLHQALKVRNCKMASALGAAIWKDKSSRAWEEILSPREQDITNSVRTSKWQALWFGLCFAEPRCPLPLSICLPAPPSFSSPEECRSVGVCSLAWQTGLQGWKESIC